MTPGTRVLASAKEADNRLSETLTNCLAELPVASCGYLSARQLKPTERCFDLALGRTQWGTIADCEDLLQVGCTAKPLLPLLISVSAPDLLHAEVVVGAQVVDDQAKGIQRVPMSVASILTHAAGLVGPDAATWRMLGSATTRDELLGAVTISRVPRYSELSGWLLLEALFERATGRDPGEALDSDVLRPLGLTESIKIRDARSAAHRVVVPRVESGGSQHYLLSESLPSELTSCRPAFGGLASCAGLADLYMQILRVRAGAVCPGLPGPAVLQKLFDMHGPQIDDPSLGRPHIFNGCFMLNAESDLFPGLSAKAFGHSGGFGVSMAGADPESDLSFAFAFNGMTSDRPKVGAVRDRLFEALRQWAGWNADVES